LVVVKGWFIPVAAALVGLEVVGAVAVPQPTTTTIPININPVNKRLLLILMYSIIK
jgi:hypothetical protein